MRYSKEHKAETRNRILDAAGRVFRRLGYHGGGVDAVMKEAGLTHGGFYAHFRNKEALFSEAVSKALLDLQQMHRSWTEGKSGPAWVRAFLRGYLSRKHAEHLETGCAVPPLVSELGRAGETPKQAFEANLAGWQKSIAEHLAGSDPEREQQALAVIVACVGGMALARAVDSPELADRILAGSREMVECAFLENAAEHEEPAS